MGKQANRGSFVLEKVHKLIKREDVVARWRLIPVMGISTSVGATVHKLTRFKNKNQRRTLLSLHPQVLKKDQLSEWAQWYWWNVFTFFVMLELLSARDWLDYR